MPFCLSASEHRMDSLWRELDHAVANYHQYINARNQEIHQLRQSLAVASFSSDHYLIGQQIFQKYRKFDSDSALYYAHFCKVLGEQEKRQDWIMESRLNEVEIYSLRNVQPLATQLLYNMGGIDSVPATLKAYYSKIQLDNLFRQNRQLQQENYKVTFDKQKEACAEYKQYRSFLSSQSYDYPYFLLFLEPQQGEKTEKLVRNQIARIDKSDNDKQALLEYTLARLLEQKSDSSGYREHLLRSAICDVKAVNRDGQSLLLLIKELGKNPTETNVKRAFRYAQLCEENARIYKDVGRSLQYINAQSVVKQGYLQIINVQRNRLKITLSVTVVMLLVIATLLALLYKKKRSLDASYLQQQEAYKKLDEKTRQALSMKEEIEWKNELLCKEMKARDVHFIKTFYLCLEYIQDIKKFQKKISALIKTNQIADIKQAAQSLILGQEEHQRLYAAFDAAFLDIHPDFMQHINELLLPENQMKVKEGPALPPELRIYALFCLGITDSASVANFLHYSPQTVYNYRFRIRHISRDPDTFEESVKKLYS